MESAFAARDRLRARQQELTDELDRVQRALGQLETTVVVSVWWTAPSGPKKRGTAYHTGKDRRCRPTGGPEVTLYEALRAGLAPCGRCKPRGS